MLNVRPDLMASPLAEFFLLAFGLSSAFLTDADLSSASFLTSRFSLPSATGAPGLLLSDPTKVMPFDLNDGGSGIGLFEATALVDSDLSLLED